MSEKTFRHIFCRKPLLNTTLVFDAIRSILIGANLSHYLMMTPYKFPHIHSHRNGHFCHFLLMQMNTGKSLSHCERIFINRLIHLSPKAMDLAKFNGNIDAVSNCTASFRIIVLRHYEFPSAFRIFFFFQNCQFE